MNKKTGTNPRDPRRKKGGLGKMLQRDKAKAKKNRNRRQGDGTRGGVLGTGGADAGGLESMLQTNSLEEFIANAVMADREFIAEREHVVMLDMDTQPQLKTAGGFAAPVGSVGEVMLDADLCVETLQVPRRPPWEVSMTAEELDRNERESFLQWRRQLAMQEEARNLGAVSPFEKNLQVWRQLWRVLERSDVLVQVVDARNPLFYRSADLDRYAREESTGSGSSDAGAGAGAGAGDLKKQTMLVINKADYLTPWQRRAWAEYLHKQGIAFVFFSARASQAELDDDGRLEPDAAEAVVDCGCAHEHDGPADAEQVDMESVPRVTPVLAEAGADAGVGAEAEAVIEPAAESGAEAEAEAVAAHASASAESVGAQPPPPPAGDTPDSVDPELYRVLGREELMQRLRDMEPGQHAGDGEGGGVDSDSDYEDPANAKPPFVVGLVGFPNVGKSSLINVLCAVTQSTHGKGARVSVGANPGHTKHFQTIKIDENLTLCDCPGLVFPLFTSSTDEMYCNSVLPISQLRDYVAPVTMVCRRIARRVLNGMYGITLTAGTGELESGVYHPPGARELLKAIATKRSWMAAGGKGMPDERRASILVLKDFQTGRLLFCHPPPGLSEATRAYFVNETYRRARVIGANSTGGAGTIAAGQHVRSITVGVDPMESVVDAAPSRTQMRKKKGRKGYRDPDPYGTQTPVGLGIGVKKAGAKVAGRKHEKKAKGKKNKYAGY